MKKSVLIATVVVACGEKEVHVVFVNDDAISANNNPEVRAISNDTQVSEKYALPEALQGFMNKAYKSFDIPGSRYSCFMPVSWYGVQRETKLVFVHNDTGIELSVSLEVSTTNTSPQEMLLSLFAQTNIMVEQRYDTQAMDVANFVGDSENVGIRIAILQFYDFTTFTCAMVLPSFLTQEQHEILYHAYETIVTTLHKREVF